MNSKSSSLATFNNSLLLSCFISLSTASKFKEVVLMGYQVLIFSTVLIKSYGNGEHLQFQD